MKIFKKFQRHTECPDYDFCKTCGVTKLERCERCRYYRCIDSAIGYCFYNPEPLPVAWCRDACSQFKVGIKE